MHPKTHNPIIRAAAIAALSLGAAAALAGSAGAEIAQGCYTRDYTAAHLAKNPNQHVAALQIALGPDPWGNGFIAAMVSGHFSDQGRARSEGFSGHSFSQSAFCGENNGVASCYIECDGGGFTIRRSSRDMLEIETDRFTLEVGGTDSDDGCGGLSDLAETGSPKTIYRLSRAPASTCRSAP